MITFLKGIPVLVSTSAARQQIELNLNSANAVGLARESIGPCSDTPPAILRRV